jgi:diguanylate cyclase (GGDEF)-like protein
MRLIRRSDTTLVIALIVGTVMIFQQPLRWALQIAHEIALRYHVDLLPALTVLIVVFVFHQYRKRQEAKADMRALSAETAQACARAQELERLMVCGRALANALDRPALQQVLARALPPFAGDRECWILTRHGERWNPLLEEMTTATRRPVETLETVAAAAASASGWEPPAAGVEANQDVCFPLTAGGAAVGVLGVLNEPPLPVSERRALGAAAALVAIAVRNVQLLQDAREHGVRDSLTGCLNRGHGLEMLDIEIKRARRTGRPVSVLLLDIDHFKRVNDPGGHLRGDAVLAAVGAQLNQVLRSTDGRCRYGGDEFLVILPDTPPLGAQQVAETLRRGLAAVRLPDDPSLSITTSIGVAVSFPGAHDDAAGIIGRADAALYRAKRAGRNRCGAPDLPHAVTRTPDMASLAIEASDPFSMDQDLDPPTTGRGEASRRRTH